jgi:cytochrome c-type biogenesis protein CcmH/NrfF
VSQVQLASTLVPVAHAGHWILYLGPVLVVAAAVLASALRERRAREGEDENEDEDVPGPED